MPQRCALSIETPSSISFSSTMLGILLPPYGTHMLYPLHITQKDAQNYMHSKTFISGQILISQKKICPLYVDKFWGFKAIISEK